MVNAARRLLAEEDSTPGIPIYRLDVVAKLEEKRIESVRVPMVPMGMSFRAGEKLRVIVSGRDRQVYPPVEQATLTVGG